MRRGSLFKLRRSRESGLLQRANALAFYVILAYYSMNQLLNAILTSRCFAALGDVSKARFIQQINDQIDEITSTTGVDGSRHPLVRARMAVLNKKFKEAEGIYLEQGMIDQAMEMYQELHKWDDSLEIAARKASK